MAASVMAASMATRQSRAALDGRLWRPARASLGRSHSPDVYIHNRLQMCVGFGFFLFAHARAKIEEPPA